MKEEPDKNHNLTFCTTIVQSFSYKQQQVIANDFTSAHFDNTFWRCGIQVEDEGINYYDNMVSSSVVTNNRFLVWNNIIGTN